MARKQPSTNPEFPWVNELAKQLIARHVAVSLPDAPRDSLLPNEDTKRALIERDTHVIAVVGSGASYPQLERGQGLAAALRKKGWIDEAAVEAELTRLSRVYDLSKDDFETQLVAISQTPDAARRVREAISTGYRVRHPTILGYELLAHLLKHRFIDAIVSFNFDELLDQSLDDELGRDEYACVVSERDCVGLETQVEKPGYIPLYVKMHGTASEPESLRFTRESYYAIPKQLMSVVEGLFNANHCVLINVGFGMLSFDFQHLLRLPEYLDIYDLSYKRVPPRVVRKINDERKYEGRHEASFEPEKHSKESCERQLSRLVKTMEAETERGSEWEIARFRGVQRHRAVAQLLGHASAAGRRLTAAYAEPTEATSDIVYADYLKKRAILELAFSGVKARGIESTHPLAVDRGGAYYDRYKAKCHPDSLFSWRDLCVKAGLREDETFPDIVVADEDVSVASHDETHPFRRMRTFDPEKLADRVLNTVANPPEPGDRDQLIEALKELGRGTDIELHSNDDRVCAKTFTEPVTLKTRTALEGYTRWMLERLDEGATVMAVTETGEWLLAPPIRSALQNASSVRVLVAFDTMVGDGDESERLSGVFGDRLQARRLDPWRHNRHMTVACLGDVPSRAIYFARRLRTAYVTPVWLPNALDAARLAKSFEQLWEDAEGDTLWPRAKK